MSGGHSVRDHHGCDGLPTAHLVVVRVWLYAPMNISGYRPAAARRRRRGAGRGGLSVGGGGEAERLVV